MDVPGALPSGSGNAEGMPADRHPGGPVGRRAHLESILLVPALALAAGSLYVFRRHARRRRRLLVRLERVRHQLGLRDFVRSS